MNKSFYDIKEMDFRYPELGICLEDTLGKRTAKIAIPVATPTLPMQQPYDIKDNSLNTSNILSNTTPLNVKKCTTSNYLTLNIPTEIKYLYKGDRVILMFIGGDMNKPFILRRYTG